MFIQSHPTCAKHISFSLGIRKLIFFLAHLGTLMPGQCFSYDDEDVTVTSMGDTSKKVEDGGGASWLAIAAEISMKADHVVMAAKAKELRVMPPISIGMVRVATPFTLSLLLLDPFLYGFLDLMVMVLLNELLSQAQSILLTK